MKIIEGDLIQLAKQGEFDVIVHGCNCQCVMGKGLALAMKNEFPEVYIADILTKSDGEHKLGLCSWAIVKVNVHSFIILNAYIQLDWRGSGVKVDYGALRRCFKSVKKKFSGKRIAYPKIGAGLAGGDWGIISKIIDEELQGEDHTLVIYSGK